MDQKHARMVFWWNFVKSPRVSKAGIVYDKVQRRKIRDDVDDSILIGLPPQIGYDRDDVDFVPSLEIAGHSGEGFTILVDQPEGIPSSSQPGCEGCTDAAGRTGHQRTLRLRVA